MKVERELIATIRARAARSMQGRSSIVRAGIGDDCALLRPRRGEELAVTTDFSLENVHFRRDWHPPESVGHRCLARGLSDLAAMGARPEAAFLSLAVPRSLPAVSFPADWIDRFLNGLFRLADRHRVPLAGGDIAEAPGPSQDGGGLISADIVLLGRVPQGRALLRSGARAGDTIYVTGELGGAAAELRALELRGAEKRPAAFRRRDTAPHPHLYPEPRIAAGRRLMLAGLATAAIDLSDGLSTDLSHLCEESDVAAEIEAQAIPVAEAASLPEALHGGEDYELLFTARPGTKIPARLGGIPVHAIGTMRAVASQKRASRAGTAARMTLLAADGARSPLRPGGWEHFRA